jgi:carboxymethylenebutenolidase
MHESKDITFDGVRARIVQPSDPNGAGILQIPSWQGLDVRTDAYAQGMADAGFTVLSWDPFSAFPSDLPLEDRRRITSGEIRDVDARAEHVRCVDYLIDQLGCEGIGSIGYCMGGRMCMLVAAGDPRVKACSAYYPTLKDPVPAWALDVKAEAAVMEAAVQIHYPQLDFVTSYLAILETRLALEARSAIATTITSVYTGAHHGFLRAMDEADARAARVAWPGTIAFFRSVLLSSSDWTYSDQAKVARVVAEPLPRT